VKTTEVTVTWIDDQSSDEASLKDRGTFTLCGDAVGGVELAPPPPPQPTSAIAQAMDVAERARIRDEARECGGAWRVIVVSMCVGPDTASVRRDVSWMT
jgi:hypothetical protein